MKKIILIPFLIALVILISCNSVTENEYSINIATYNIRMDTPNDSLDPWQHRKEMIKGLVTFHDFDVFGTQEGFKHQLEDILDLENYAYVGVGRDDGVAAGEHSAIFYKKNKFDVLKNGDFWYSETPDTPSLGWDATCCHRICSWVQLKDKENGKTFFVFNSHYDHEGEEARKNSSTLLLSKIEEIAGNNTVFCTGDFNATPNSEPIQIIYNDETLKDSYLISEQKPYGTEATFNNFRVKHSTNSRIDYIWVSKNISIKKYGTLNDIQYGHFPSDHYPVMVKAIIK